jgi:uncharacterized membrane-anchored protein YjiN (DUF445 family)
MTEKVIENLISNILKNNKIAKEKLEKCVIDAIDEDDIKECVKDRISESISEIDFEELLYDSGIHSLIGVYITNRLKKILDDEE